MNRQYSLIHYRLPFSSSLFAFLGKEKKRGGGQGIGPVQEKNDSRFTVDDCFSIKLVVISIKLLLLVLRTKEEKKHLPHLKVKGWEEKPARLSVCQPAGRKGQEQRGLGEGKGRKAAKYDRSRFGVMEWEQKGLNPLCLPLKSRIDARKPE